MLSKNRTVSSAAVLWLACAVLAASGADKRTVSSSQNPRVSPGAIAKSKPRRDAIRFRARVDAALADAHANRVFWGVLVADRDTGEVLYDLNADHFFMPASNAKIFTTALVLATLGGSYQFHTTLESAAAPDPDGKLAGDLVFVGRGDPDLSNRKFPYQLKTERDGPAEKVLAELVDTAISKGLKEVDGDIVADDSYLPYDPYPEGWSVGDLFFEFGAPVSAIAFNDNTISVHVEPGAREADPAILTVQPEVALATLSNQITTAPPGGNPYFAVMRQPGPSFLLLQGTIPLGHVPADLDLAMTAPAETAAQALKQLLEQRGVRVTGVARVVHAPAPQTSDSSGYAPPPPPPMPSAAGSNPLVLADHVSPPLIESIRLTNKISQNLHAELLLRDVAREKAGFGSTEAGLKIEQEFLKAAGVPDGDVMLYDGSGLARDDLVTPRAAVALLRYTAHQPWGDEFLSTLPIAGVDGTLQTRMKQISGPATLEAKTGSLEHARAMSGYATTERGEHLVFAIFGNNDTEHGHDATAALDAIGVAMVQTLGPAGKKRK
ncbi:MAG TPA: D-alanyl-D-alanine carboxypeptidase/D-alanyl-D-alanine-endopeptidase [Candidatus Acidoferrum sp.]|nr:D-alanyl-D-alanine carboxypeptidase/D-alanyl-D-alanine-endopeptidase [Candidatus Acidoferrum sp.]